MDQYHGQGGVYEVDKATGERRLKEAPTKPSDAGACDKDGKPLNQGEARLESALPKPGPASWASPEAPKKGKGA